MLVIVEINERQAHLVEIRAIEASNQPRRLCVRNLAEFTRNSTMNDRLLPFNDANLKASVLWFHDDFVFVESVKSFRSILAS